MTRKRYSVRANPSLRLQASRLGPSKAIGPPSLRATLIVVAAYLLCAAPLGLRSEEAGSRIETAGGTLTWELNPGALGPLGIKLDTTGFTSAEYVPGRKGRYDRLVTHIAQTSGLDIATHGQRIDGIESGMVELHDGPRFVLPQGSVDLRLARLRVVQPSTLALAVTDRSGNLWATLDHPHYGLSQDARRFWMEHFDLHIGPALAAALRSPELTGLVIGSAALNLPILRRYASVAPRKAPECSPAWPSPTARVDLEMLLLDHDPELGGLADSITVMRCGIPDQGVYKPCTPMSTEGLVVMAPDAAVKNGGSAAIAWRPMFSLPGPPYGNDQHPYLIWNLYRVDGDGAFQQVGRSGVKHAYYADNFACQCPAQGASYPTCEETYAAGTNDVSNTLGPREEIIPASGQWGRCGSVFDPECKASLDVKYFATDDGYRNRLAVRESEMLPALHPGARYLFEYGYVVRGQADPEHALAHRWVLPAKHHASNGIRWDVTPTSFALGPAINAWVDPAHPPIGSMNKLLTTPNGRVRVAVSTTRRHDGRYVYDYVIMNEDFVRAITAGREPNLKIVSASGIDQLAIPARQAGDIADLRFAGIAKDGSQDWAPKVGDDAIVWRAPGRALLQWGSAYMFSFSTAYGPEPGFVSLHVGGNDKPSSYRIQSLVPSTEAR